MTDTSLAQHATGDVASSQRLVLRSPHDFATTLTTLVGYTPTNSLVAAFIRNDIVQVTMRCDLPDQINQLGDYLLLVAQRAAADSVLLAVCAPRGRGPLPDAAGMHALIAALEDASIGVRDALLIDDGRWWSYQCQAQACCPDDGTVFTSAVVLPTRAALTARFTPRPPLDSALLDAAAAGLPVLLQDRGDHVMASLRALTDTTDDRDHHLAVLVTGVQHLQIRDLIASLVITDLDRGRLIDAVTDAALVAPGTWLPRIAGLAAALHAAHDASTLASSTLADLAGEDSLAQLVLHAQTAAVPPQAVEGILRESLPYTLAKMIAADTATQNTSVNDTDTTAASTNQAQVSAS